MNRLFLFVFLGLAGPLFGQRVPASQQMGEAIMKTWPAGFDPGIAQAAGTKEQGLLLRGIESIWTATADAKWFNYIQKSIDPLVENDGSLRSSKHGDYDIDAISTAKSILMLYQVTGQGKYRKAASLLRVAPEASNKGMSSAEAFYAMQPFYAAYAATFHQNSAFDTIAGQFARLEKEVVDPALKIQANGAGWFGMAMVDALEYFPAKSQAQLQLLSTLNRFVHAVGIMQDKQSGLWQHGNKPAIDDIANSCMLAYTMAKATRNGYIQAQYLVAARKAYVSIQQQLGKKENGQINTQALRNDPLTMAAFVSCAMEMEWSMLPQIGKGKTVMLDRYFNSEKRKDIAGLETYWHYVWNERSYPGFFVLGNLFSQYGAALSSLDEAPSSSSLNKASVYIIVDPDHLKDNPQPNYVNDADVKVISNWVRSGGVLLLLANDSANCDLEHFNKLSGAFGIRFTNTSANMVKDDAFETGAVLTNTSHPVFKQRKMFLKDISVLQVKTPAKALVLKNGQVIIASAKYGKGAVIAVGDPWLYNEYVDGRKLPANFNNYEAAADLVRWLLQAAK